MIELSNITKTYKVAKRNAGIKMHLKIILKENIHK